MIDHDGKHARRNGEVVERMLRRTERLAQSCKGQRPRGMEMPSTYCNRAARRSSTTYASVISSWPCARSRLHVLDEFRAHPTCARHSNHRYRQVAVAHKFIERREYAARTQIPGRAENHEGIGGVRSAQDSPLPCLLPSRGAWPRGFAGKIRRCRARSEARVERGAQHVCRHALLDGGLDGPPALARICYHRPARNARAQDYAPGRRRSNPAAA